MPFWNAVPANFEGECDLFDAFGMQMKINGMVNITLVSANAIDDGVF